VFRIFYKKEIICNEMIKRSGLGIDLNGASIRLYYQDCKVRLGQFKEIAYLAAGAK